MGLPMSKSECRVKLDNGEYETLATNLDKKEFQYLSEISIIPKQKVMKRTVILLHLTILQKYVNYFGYNTYS